MKNHLILANTLLPTNRKFGIFFTAIFSALAIYFYWKGWSEIAIAVLILAILFSLLTITAPQLLTSLNRLWYQLGLLLGKIVSPIVLGIIFFMMITPISLITRLLGRDELKIKKRYVESYWVNRSPSGPEPESFKNQY
jgi:hypothetical protein